VPLISLDDFADTNSLNEIHFMKMDIEGHELQALRGASRLLGDRRVSAFSFEFGAVNVRSRTFFRDFWDLTVQHGYALSRIVRGARLLPVRRYTCDLEDFCNTSNYVASLTH
jgi:hypothetical protein